MARNSTLAHQNGQDVPSDVAKEKLHGMLAYLVPYESTGDINRADLPRVEAKRYYVKLRCNVAWQLYFHAKTTGKRPCKKIQGDYEVAPTALKKTLLNTERDRSMPEARSRLVTLAYQNPKKLCTSDNKRIALGHIGQRPVARQVCSGCMGLGRLICKRCNGVGTHTVIGRSRNGEIIQKVEGCRDCFYAGKIACSACAGGGQVCEAGDLYVDVQVSASLVSQTADLPEIVARWARNLSETDFLRLAPNAMVEETRLDQGYGVGFGENIAVVYGHAYPPSNGESHEFAFLEENGEWLRAPAQLVKNYASPLFDEIKSNRTKDAQRIRELLERWPLVNTVYDNTTRNNAGVISTLADKFEGVLSEDYIREITDPLIEAQRHLAPRTTSAYWIVVAPVFAFLGTQVAPLFMASPSLRSIGIGAALALVASVYAGGYCLTQWRRRQAPVALRAPRTDGLYAALMAALLGVSAYVGVKSDYASVLAHGVGPWMDGVATVGSGGTQLNHVQVQHVLKRLGHYTGPIDGIVGPGTRSALEAFEGARGLEVDGSASSADQEALLKAWRITEVERELVAQGADLEVDGVAGERLRAHLRNEAAVAARSGVAFDAETVRAVGGDPKPPQ